MSVPIRNLANLPSLHDMHRNIMEVETEVGGDRKANDFNSGPVLESLEMREGLHDLNWRGPV